VFTYGKINLCARPYPPNYLYAIGEKASTETHPDDLESVGGFEGVLLGIILLVLYVFRPKHFKK
jgi:hypothetical protein